MHHLIHDKWGWHPRWFWGIIEEVKHSWQNKVVYTIRLNNNTEPSLDGDQGQSFLMCHSCLNSHAPWVSLPTNNSKWSSWGSRSKSTYTRFSCNVVATGEMLTFQRMRSLASCKLMPACTSPRWGPSDGLWFRFSSVQFFQNFPEPWTEP
jgi:hypothetical protein